MLQAAKQMESGFIHNENVPYYSHDTVRFTGLLRVWRLAIVQPGLG